MALTKDKKHEVVADVAQLLEASKMTVVAKYQGTSVKALQSFRRDAKGNGTVAKVVKNRLVIKALASNDKFKDADTSTLEGMLLYAFNSEDEVAPAQAIANFAKTNPTLEFVGAYTADGKFIGADDVKALATLPGKSELIAQVMATLSAPLNDTVSTLSGNLHGLLDGVAEKAAA
jgi:large subunit ribosomal protein L10